MSKPRLYYNIEELPDKSCRFFYHSEEIDEGRYQLRSFSLNINSVNVIQTVKSVGIPKLLCQMNESEYKNLLTSIENISIEIDNLIMTDPISANEAMVKMWGPKELENKFKDWFEEHGYPMPILES